MKSTMKSTYGNFGNLVEAPRPKAYVVLVVIDFAGTVHVLMVRYRPRGGKLGSSIDDLGLPGGTVNVRTDVLYRGTNAWERAPVIAAELMRECTEELGSALMGFSVEGQVPLVTVEHLLDRDKCFHHKGVNYYTNERNERTFAEMSYFVINVTERLMLITDRYTPTEAMLAAVKLVNHSHLSMSRVQQAEVKGAEFVTLQSIADSTPKAGATRVWWPHRDVLTDRHVVDMMRTVGESGHGARSDIDRALLTKVSGMHTWIRDSIRHALEVYNTQIRVGSWSSKARMTRMKDQLTDMFDALAAPTDRDSLTLQDLATALLPGRCDASGPAAAAALAAAVVICSDLGAVVQAVVQASDACDPDAEAEADHMWLAKFVTLTVSRMIVYAHPEWHTARFTDVVAMMK